MKYPGPSRSLKVSEVGEVTPETDEVKIRVETIGINYAEILSRRGQYSWAPKLPYVPGMEAFGEIVEIGSSVTDRKIGDKVIVGGQTGSYAEYMCVKSYLAFAPPTSFSPEENASVLVNYMTAWIALKKLARLQSDDKVLIQAAAGGVGTAAVQIAHKYGCKVYGTASKSEKLELIRKLGTNVAINYATDDFEQIIKQEDGGVDVVLEVVGGEVYRRSISSLNPFGRLIIAGFASISLKKWNPVTYVKTWRDAPKVNVMEMAKGSYGVMATHIGYLTGMPQVATETVQEMLAFIDKHNIRPVVGKTFSFDQLPEAHDWIESRESFGKVVIKL